MKVQNITLEQVLAARDRRVEIQNNMLTEGETACRAGACNGPVCLVCLTMNIAGEVKRTPMTKMLFNRGVAEFEALGFDVLNTELIDAPTGSEAFWLVLGDAAAVKKKLEAVEDSFPAARLFDFDVLVREGSSSVIKLSREVSRRCLICGGPAAECARSRSHGLLAVKMETGRLLKEFCAGTLADAGYASLLDELYTTPKPGLVDLANNGAHTDMDVPLFEKSAESLRPYFYDAALMGIIGCSMAELRVRGLEAEAEMFAATGGVNTHKGMIYSMGLLLAGAGKALTYRDEPAPASCFNNEFKLGDLGLGELAIHFASCYALEDAEDMMAKSAADPSTNGGRVMKAYGAKGAMWEAASGFPDAVYCAERLGHYKSGTDEAAECAEAAAEYAGVLAFCDSMSRLEDTNLLHRGGPEGLDFARTAAAEIAALSEEGRVEALRRLDDEMISRNLSPGGSADMLALAFFLCRLREIERV